MTPLQTLIRKSQELRAEGRRAAPCPAIPPAGAAGGSGCQARPAPRLCRQLRLCHSRMEFGVVGSGGRMHGRSVGRCRVCLGAGIIYPVPLLVPIPTVFAINSSI